MRAITSKQVDRANLLFRGRMATTPFLDHPSFKYSFESSGFNDFTFGAKTGPSIGIDNLFHEMSHAVDFVLCGDDIEHRSLGGRYTFNVKMKSFNGKLYEQLETNQCTMRELRVFAIQIKFMHLVGFKNSLEFLAKDYSRLSVWLPDWFLVDGNSDPERIEWCRKKIIELYHQYDAQQILDAFQIWLDKIEIIQAKPQ